MRKLALKKSIGQSQLRRFTARTTALIVLFCFMAANTLHPESLTAPAFPAVEVPRHAAQAGERPLVPDFRIPEAVGTINEIDVAGGQGIRPVIAHIQDAHGSYEAQKNIQKIIRHLVDEYGFSLLLLEGAAQPLDPKLFQIFEDQSLNLKVADYLAQSGELTGGELYLLESGGAIPAEGIEDAQAYADNLRAFRGILEREPQSAQFLRVVRTRIETLGSRALNKELRDFLRDWQAWREERVELSGFLSLVKRAAQKALRLDLSGAEVQSDYPMLVRYFKAKAIDSSFDLPQAEQERDLILAFLEDKAVPEEMGARLKSWDLRAGISDWKDELPRLFLERLYTAVRAYAFRFNDYPAFTSALAALIFQSEIQAEPFFREIDLITDRLFDALIQREEERRLITLFKDSMMLEKLLMLELARDEYRAILKQPARYDPNLLWERLDRARYTEGNFQKKAAQLNQNDPKADLESVSEIFRKAVDFYDTARKREDYLVANADEHLRSRGAGRAIIVTGGFHSEGLKKQFARKNYSYIEIAPRINSVDGIEEVYHRAILERSQVGQLLRSVSGQVLLSELRALVGPEYRGAALREALLRAGIPRDEVNDYIGPDGSPKSELRNMLRNSSGTASAADTIDRAELRAGESRGLEEHESAFSEEHFRKHRIVKLDEDGVLQFMELDYDGSILQEPRENPQLWNYRTKLLGPAVDHINVWLEKHGYGELKEDETKWTGIFFELMLNAYQAFEPSEKGKIRITLRSQDERNAIEISNQGAAISEDILNRLVLEPVEEKGVERGMGYGRVVREFLRQVPGASVSVLSRTQEGVKGYEYTFEPASNELRRKAFSPPIDVENLEQGFNTAVTLKLPLLSEGRAELRVSEPIVPEITAILGPHQLIRTRPASPERTFEIEYRPNETQINFYEVDVETGTIVKRVRTGTERPGPTFQPAAQSRLEVKANEDQDQYLVLVEEILDLFRQDHNPVVTPEQKELFQFGHEELFLFFTDKSRIEILEPETAAVTPGRSELRLLSKADVSAQAFDVTRITDRTRVEAVLTEALQRDGKSVLQVTLRVAQGVVDLAVLTSAAGAIVLHWLAQFDANKQEKRVQVALGPEWADVYEAFQKRLFDVVLPEQDIKPSVALSHSNPLAKHLLNPNVVSTLLALKDPVRVRVAAPDGQFKRWFEERVVKMLDNPVLKGIVSRIFRIRPLELNELTALESRVGVQVPSLDDLENIEAHIPATIANIDDIDDPETAAQLVIPILTTAATLARFAGDKDLSAAALEHLQVELTLKLEDLGISLEVGRGGRFIASINSQVMRAWLLAELARRSVESAA